MDLEREAEEMTWKEFKAFVEAEGVTDI